MKEAQDRSLEILLKAREGEQVKKIESWIKRLHIDSLKIFGEIEELIEKYIQPNFVELGYNGIENRYIYGPENKDILENDIKKAIEEERKILRFAKRKKDSNSAAEKILAKERYRFLAFEILNHNATTKEEKKEKEELERKIVNTVKIKDDLSNLEKSAHPEEQREKIALESLFFEYKNTLENIEKSVKISASLQNEEARLRINLIDNIPKNNVLKRRGILSKYFNITKKIIKDKELELKTRDALSDLNGFTIIANTNETDEKIDTSHSRNMTILAKEYLNRTEKESSKTRVLQLLCRKLDTEKLEKMFKKHETKFTEFEKLMFKTIIEVKRKGYTIKEIDDFFFNKRGDGYFSIQIKLEDKDGNDLELQIKTGESYLKAEGKNSKEPFQRNKFKESRARSVLSIEESAKIILELESKTNNLNIWRNLSKIVKLSKARGLQLIKEIANINDFESFDLIDSIFEILTEKDNKELKDLFNSYIENQNNSKMKNYYKNKIIKEFEQFKKDYEEIKGLMETAKEGKENWLKRQSASYSPIQNRNIKNQNFEKLKKELQNKLTDDELVDLLAHINNLIKPMKLKDRDIFKKQIPPENGQENKKD